MIVNISNRDFYNKTERNVKKMRKSAKKANEKGEGA